MTKYLGKDFTVFSMDIASATNPIKVATMRTTSLALATDQIDVTEKDSMPHRALMEGGVRSRDISLAGIISNAAILMQLLGDANVGRIRYFKLVSGLGYTFVGLFQVAKCELSGDHDKEEVYTLNLMSSEEIIFTPPA